MWNHPKEDNLFEQFGKFSKKTGLIFIILGLVGIIFPTFMTIATVVFISWIMLFAGITAAYFTYISDKSDWLGWLKSFILIGAALLILFYPLSGAATIGLLLAIYFFMDAFAGFALASSVYPNRGWWLWIINALLSFGLAVVFLMNWPFSSIYMVGIFIGISLFFDGLALYMGGFFWHKMGK